MADLELEPPITDEPGQYDQAVDQTPAAPAAPAAAGPRNAYDDLFDQEDAGRQSRLRTSLVQAADKSPDRAAQVQQLSTRTGLAPEVIDRNFDEILKRSKFATTPYTEMLKDSPAVATWAAEPVHAAVAQDDMENLGALEWLMKAPARAINQVLNQQAYGDLRTKSMFRDLTQAEHDQLETYRYHAQEDSRLGTGKSWFRGAITGGMQLLTMLGTAQPYALAGAAGGAVVGGAGGSLVGPGGTIAGAAKGAAIGYEAGNIYGMGKTAFMSEAGSSYDQYLEMKDEHGQPLDPQVAKLAALATGAINAGLMLGAGKVVQSTIPGLEKLTGGYTRDAVQAALRQPRIRAALLEGASTWAKGVTEGTAVMVAMRAVNIMGGALAEATGQRAAVPGQIEQGNINLFAQPEVKNPNGSISTVDSISIGIDGKEVLLPQVTPDGRHFHSADEAFAEYQATGRHLGKFDTPAAATAFAEQLHNDYAAGKYKPQHVGEQLLEAAASGFQSMALVTAAGPMSKFVADAQRAMRAKQAPLFFQALGEGVAQSKTNGRLPEAMQKFVAEAVKDGPIKTLYQPVETWRDYWQSKGVDPAEMAAKVTGSRDAYDEALKTGEDLAIPTEKYASLLAGTEHNAFFANELRLGGPEEMNGRERAKLVEDIKTAAETLSQQPPDPTDPAAEGVKRAILEKMTQAGIPADVAEAYARLPEALFTQLAERSGFDLAGRYDINVERPTAEPVQPSVPRGTSEQPRAAKAPIGAGSVPTTAPAAAGATPAPAVGKPVPTAQSPADAAAAAAPVETKAYQDWRRQLELTAARLDITPSEAVAHVGPEPDRYEPVPKPRATASAAFQAQIAAMKKSRDLFHDQLSEQWVRDGIARTRNAAGVEHVVHESTSEPGKFQITSFENGEPTGHRVVSSIAEAAKELAGETIVDKNAAAPQTGQANGPEFQTRGGARQAGSATGDGPAASYPRERESRAQFDERRTKHYQSLYKYVLGAAKKLDPTVNKRALRAEFDQRLARFEDLQQLYRESGNNPKDLLRAIAGLGGIHDPAYRGEIGDISDGTKFGSLHGHKVFRAKTVKDNRGVPTSGLSLDLMATTLKQDPRFAWIDGPNTLIDALDEISRSSPDEAHLVLPGAGELYSDLGIDPSTTWWDQSWRNVDLMDASTISDSERDILEPQGPVDTSFNIDEFSQSLFDDLQEPDPANVTMTETPTQADRLDTGELQPRLPGAGDVRDQNVATPQLEAPFSLTSEIAKPRTKKERAGGPSPQYLKALEDSRTASAAFAEATRAFRAREIDDAAYLAARQANDAAAAKFDEAFTLEERRGGSRTLFQSAYHGSPHEFDEFKLNAIGSGEGNQAYGWGLYFAGEKEVAEYYRDKLTEQGKRGRLYTVEIPDDHNMLDYDRAASQQSPKVKVALKKLGVEWDDTHIPTAAEGLELFNTSDWIRENWFQDVGIRESLKEGLHYAKSGDDRLFGLWYEKNIGLMTPEGNNDPTGGSIYDQLQTQWMQDHPHLDREQSAHATSLMLRQAGILGVKYLDGNSRYKLEGSSNYVVFDDRHVQIREFNQPPAPLTTASVQAWTDEIKRKVGPDLATFDVRIVQGGDLFLEGIGVKRGAARAGLGTRVLQELTRFADLNGRRLTLNPAHEGYSPAEGVAPTTSAKRLVKFYERFGFVENTGKNLNLLISEQMYREPTLPTLGQPLFHGSPHDFERFSLEHVGTGEGAAAYGWGLYFAENRDVAAGYHDRLSGDPQVRRMKIGALTLTTANSDYSRNAHISDLENIRASLAEDLLLRPLELLGAGEGGFREHVLKVLDGKISDYETEWPEGAVAGKELRAELEKPGALTIKFDPKSGGVYQVDIPDEHIGNMIAWEAPIKDQPTKVQEFVRAFLKDQGYLRAKDNGPRQLSAAFKSYTMERGGFANRDSGEMVYSLAIDAEAHKLARAAGLTGKPGPEGNRAIEDMKRDPKIEERASKALAAAGIPGLRYFDAGSRDAGDGTRNVVVFDDSIVKLTHKDGTPFTAAERKEFMQEGPGAGAPTPQQRRGAIRFGAGNQQITISLFEKADLSTFLHESGHLFLEVMGDVADQISAIAPEARTDTQQGLISDYETVLKSFHTAATDTFGVSSREQITTEHHEQFARAFEAYLMTGKAPDLKLQSTFARFRAWLTGIYRTLKNLNVDLTPEVSAVFDRLLASDQAIADAKAQRGIEAMFTTPESAGMSADEFSLYRQTVADASQRAREELDGKLMREVAREQSREWKSRREEIRTTVEAEVFGENTYRALAAIKSGENPDGTPITEGQEPQPLTLSAGIIKERYGAERLKRLPRGLARGDGELDPNTVAEMYGFSSGDAMLSALEAAPPAKTVIEQRTKQQMIAEHGSILLDGSLHEKARAAISNEDRDIIIRKELKALGQQRRRLAPAIEVGRRQGEAAGAGQLASERAERAYERRWFEAEAKLRVAIAQGQKQTEIDALQDTVNNLRQKARGGAATIRAAIPPAAAMRDAAKDRIAQMKIREIDPDRFWSASRRAGVQALERAARQDFDGAIVAKQQELINLNMYRQAEAALEDIQDRVRGAMDLTKPSRRAALGKAGDTYLDQVDGILDRFEFAKVSDKVLERRANLRDWAEALEAQGLPVDLPDMLLDEARRLNYRDMTTEQLIGVTDGLRQIVHLANLKNRLLKNADDREFAAVRDGVVDTIRTNKAATPLPNEFRAADERRRGISNWFASHRKIGDITQAMDGYADGGRMWEAFMRPLNAAADAEQVRKIEAGQAYAKIVEQYYPGRELARLKDTQEIPAINASLSKEARLAIALNQGSETNKARLLADPQRKWSPDQITSILDTLDKRDWDFVQATWDYLNTFWPEIEAKQKRVTGLAPEKVEAATVHTKYGDYKGGYYPLVYDGRLNPRARQNEAVGEAKLTTAAAYVRNTTKRGHTKARLENVKSSVRLDLGVAFGHLEQVIHDLTHHETLIDVGRLMRDGQVVKAINETHGDLVYEQLTRALQDIAIGSTPAARTTLDKSMTFLRTGSQIAGLGWNLWTGLQQPLGMFNGMARVGVPWVTRGLVRWLRDAATMENTSAWISELSPMMRERSMTATADLHDLRAAFRRPGGWFDGIVRKVSADTLTQQNITDSFLWHIALAQRVADIPTWLGQFEKSRAAGEPEARAAALADQAVLDSQGGGNVKDLAQIERGGPIAKVFMTFYSYGNTVFNATRREVGMLNPRSPTSYGVFLGHLGLIYFVPALATTVLSRMTGRRGGPDDSWEKFGKDMAREGLSTAMNTMVLVRELSGLVQDGARGYAGPAGTRVLETFYNLGHQIEQGNADEALAKAINSTAGVLFHYPANQVQRTVDGWIALQEGRTRNPGVLLVGPPPKPKGK